jgi:hypothetical protein
LNPFEELTVIVDVPLAPCTRDMDVGFALIEKSGVMVTVRARDCE